MSALMLASELTHRTVVTLGGEAVAQVKDTVVDARAGRITGFTLNGRGMFAGPLKRTLPFSGVHAVGPAAVMITDEAVLADRDALLARGEAGHGGVPGAPVVTDQGTEVGTVLDLVVTDDGRVIGFRVAANEQLDSERRDVFVHRPDTLAVSGKALVVPTGVGRFVASGPATFAAQVEAFLSQEERAADGRGDKGPRAPDGGGAADTAARPAPVGAPGSVSVPRSVPAAGSVPAPASAPGSAAEAGPAPEAVLAPRNSEGEPS